jgi:hypothetical protein
MMDTVIGANANPAWSAEKCWARWKNRLKTKISP